MGVIQSTKQTVTATMSNVYARQEALQQGQVARAVDGASGICGLQGLTAQGHTANQVTTNGRIVTTTGTAISPGGRTGNGIQGRTIEGSQW
jgi:hypothetical protein